MTKVPNHIALLLDGNRRWARSNGMAAINGHHHALGAVEAFLEKCKERGIHTVTLWGFSTENWKRDEIQVKTLMGIFEKFLDKHHDRVIRERTRVVHLGRKDRLPKVLAEKIAAIESETKEFTDHLINIAIDYGGRDEIIRAIQKMGDSGVDLGSVNEENFNDFLDTAGQQFPEPDLIIRTGGALRMSGFMMWQSAYSEFCFLDTFLPDLKPEEVDSIIDDYGNRERRFGGGK